jgi:hypothetical protein
LVRQLASGRLTNDEFEKRWPASADPALSAARRLMRARSAIAVAKVGLQCIAHHAMG